MSVAGDLKQREEADNEADALNVGQKHENQLVNNGQHDDLDGYDRSADGLDDYDEEEFGKRRSGEYTDSHGDVIGDANWNKDSSEDIKSKEENPDSLYKSGDKAPTGFTGRFLNGAKRFGPSGGIIGLLMVGLIGGGGSTLLAGSLLINVKELFHSDRADASRTNRLNSRAFTANKFNNKDGCAKKTPICDKMSSMSAKQVKDYVSPDSRFKIKGAVIDADGKDTGQRIGEQDGDADNLDPTHRVRVEEMQYPDGTVVKNGQELYGHADSKPSALRSIERAFHSKASFYLNQYFDGVLAKFNASKANKPFPAPGEDNNDPNNQASDENNQDKVFNQEAGAIHADPNGTNDGIGKKAEELTNDVGKGADGERAKASPKGGAMGTLIQGTCTAYRLARLAEVSVKAYHAIQLIKFGVLFLQAADQIKDGKGDGNRVTYLSNNLTYYQNEKETKRLADKESDADKKQQILDKKNLTATDSEGYKIATHGDVSGLKEFSEKFILGGGIGKLANNFTSKFETVADKTPGLRGDNGRQKMKDFCRLAGSPAAMLTTGCGSVIAILTAASPGIGTAFGAAGCACLAYELFPGTNIVEKLPELAQMAIPLAGQCETVESGARSAMDLLIRAVKSDSVQGWIAQVLRSLNVDDNTKGVDAGNAIASAAGLLLSTTASGYGLKPASKKDNNKEVSDYITYTEPLEQTYVALEKDDAKQNPFDAENKYSLVGSIVRSLKPENFAMAQSGSYGLFSTISSLYSNSIKILTGTQSVEALYSQPSNLGDKATERLNHCDDGDLAGIEATGDTFCSIVGVSSMDELKSAKEQAYTPGNKNINKLIDWMTTDQSADEAGGGTYCSTNGITEDSNTSSCGDKSKTRSIDDKGVPTPGSQYELYLKNCTDQRKASWGGQYEADYIGSQRDQDWFSGKQCMNDSTMLKNFRMWTNYCLQSATMDGTLNCYEDTGKSQPTTGTGDACSLLNNPNIVYVIEGTKQGLKEICETGKSVNSCGDTNYKLDQELMDVVTTLSSKYKVWLNNFGFKYDRNSCDGGQHPKGKAVDLNGIEKLGGGRAGGSEWGGITYSDPKQVAIINEYASDWLAALDPSHGGVGQKGCSNSFNPSFAGQSNVNGAAFFADSCDHLHIDVRDRGGGGGENRTSL